MTVEEIYCLHLTREETAALMPVQGGITSADIQIVNVAKAKHFNTYTTWIRGAKNSGIYICLSLQTKQMEWYEL
jgi:hypothetical protein